MRIEIVPAKRHYCGKLARTLRREHRWALERRGFNVHRELRTTYESSYLCRACLFDGEVVAMWGALGSALSPFAFVWACLSERAARRPLLLIRETRKQLVEIAADKRELVTCVLPEDEAAQRFAAFVGFHANHEGPGRRAWSKQGRDALLDFIRNAPDNRVFFGSGYLIRLGYHDEPEDVPCA